MNLKYLRLSNYNFSCNFYQEFLIKYFWRDWLVIVLIYIEGCSDVYLWVCDGVVKLVYRIKDLVIDSVECDKLVFYMGEI